VASAHSGSASAQVGSTSPSGDSSVAQTFTVPSNMNTLSFYYKMTCPDTVTYDWATATLAGSGGTTVLLAPQCSTNASWVQVSTKVTPGATYTLTLASHDDNYAADPSYTLYDDVTLSYSNPVTNPIVNGGFENGFTGWTRTGSTSTSTSARSGSAAALVGSGSPTNTSSVAQTFTAPSGASKLSFYYKMTCPDTVSYDWVTATLRDNTTATTSTILAKTCATNSGYVGVSAGLTGGHSYTLTLTNRDDDYFLDPSYTLFDDVSVQ
jgi:serine protease